jgi:hypothetical protein
MDCRPERQVTEFNVMANEVAKLNIAGYSVTGDIAVYESSHSFRMLNESVEDQSQEALMAALRVQLHDMSVADV